MLEADVAILSQCDLSSKYCLRQISRHIRYEARRIAGLVKYLIKQGYTKKGDITILTPYLGQLFVLKEIIGRANVLKVQVCSTGLTALSFVLTG